MTVSRVSGALFKNDKKEKPSHPDYRGDAMIKGRKFWVSAWIKKGPEHDGSVVCAGISLPHVVALVVDR